jgi:glycosyltransferase involved in cell wall biosynthesis
MKIGFDAKRLFNNFTGLGNYSRTLVNNLMRFEPDHSLFLYTTSIHPELFEKLYNKDIPNVKTPPHLGKHLWRSYTIKNSLKKDQIQLFHGLSNEIPFSFPCSDFGSVVTIHDLIFKTCPSTYSFFDRQIYDRKFRFSCRNASRIIAISESTRQDIIKYYDIAAEKIEVLYQACDPLFYDSPSFADMELLQGSYGIPRDYILYVGSVIERKNLKTLISALAHLPADQRIPLVVVGNGREYMKQARQLAVELGLENLVIWVSNLHNNRHLRQIYQGAKIFVFPGLYEGFGLPVAEALLSGCPVITTGGSSLPEAAGPGSLFLDDPFDSSALSHLIDKLLSDESMQKSLAKAGEAYAREKFDPESLTRQLTEIYRSI